MNLRRITTTREYIPEIDGLRFIAIFAVLLVHISNELLYRTNGAVPVQPYYQPLIAVLGHCTRGVEIFFVISGFILGRPFARQYLLGAPRVSLRNYFLRRLTRLEPPYLLAVTGCAAIFVLVNHTSPRAMLPHYLATLFYVHGLIYPYPPFFLTVVWTLAVEVQFYILVPVLVALAFGIPAALPRRALLTGIILACGAAQYFLLDGASSTLAAIASASLLNYLQYFLAGFLLSDLHLLAMPRWQTSRAWDLAGLAAWALIFWLPYWWTHMALPLLILVAFMATFLGPVANGFLRLPPITVIGGMCYSLYLLHVYAMAFAFRATRHLMVFDDFLANLATQLVLLLVPILAAGTAYFVLVERPCMDPGWPRKLLARLRAARPAAPTAGSA